MIFIVVKFETKPEWTEHWLDLVADFTLATRAEPGNLWFDLSRSVDDPNEFVLVEAFEPDGAGPHVNSDHFRQALRDMTRHWPRHPGLSTPRSTASMTGHEWANSPSADPWSSAGAQPARLWRQASHAPRGASRMCESRRN